MKNIFIFFTDAVSLGESIKFVYASCSFSIGRRLFRCCTYLIKLVRRLFREAIKTTRSLYIPFSRILWKSKHGAKCCFTIFTSENPLQDDRIVRIQLPAAALTGIPPERGCDPLYIFSVENNLTVIYFVRMTKFHRIRRFQCLQCCLKMIWGGEFFFFNSSRILYSFLIFFYHYTNTTADIIHIILIFY